MKARCDQMMGKSVAAMLSAIEIYNKPDFKYREESFVVLAVNAWELLFKAKILKDTKNRLNSLYVYDSRKRIRRTRTGNPMTTELTACMRKTPLDPVIAANIELLIDIRDTAIHFFHNRSLKYVIYTLGSACLKNYQLMIKEWFEQSLLDYNFYIMPLAFAHDFSTLGSIDLKKAPEELANIVKSAALQQEQVGEGGRFSFACEVTTRLVSAKKYTDAADLTVKIDQDAADAAIAITKKHSKLDQYPYGYQDLIRKIKEQRPHVKTSLVNDIIKQYKIKTDPRCAAFSFRTKPQEEAFNANNITAKGLTSIYNDNALRFILSKIDK